MYKYMYMYITYIHIYICDIYIYTYICIITYVHLYVCWNTIYVRKGWALRLLANVGPGMFACPRKPRSLTCSVASAPARTSAAKARRLRGGAGHRGLGGRPKFGSGGHCQGQSVPCCLFLRPTGMPGLSSRQVLLGPTLHCKALRPPAAGAHWSRPGVEPRPWLFWCDLYGGRKMRV